MRKCILSGILLLVLSFMLSSCGSSGGNGPGGGDPGLTFPNTPEGNFEALWQNFDQRYSHFEIKNIDWQAVYNEFRPQVHQNTSNQELFNIMKEMLSRLKDGHVNLNTTVGDYAYDGWWKNYPLNFNKDLIKADYLPNGGSTNGKFLYGVINNQIGYLYIQSFEGDSSSWTRNFDSILESFKNLKAIVIDVRGNGGGNSMLGDIIAERFADQERIVSYISWRNVGKEHTFTTPSACTIKPRGPWRFDKPVILLTNRQCFSSCEMFVLDMRILPQVTVIGDTTGGGSANPIQLMLPNGWTYRVPRWIEYTPERQVYEDIGLAPDIKIDLVSSDEANGKDTIIEKAMEVINH